MPDKSNAAMCRHVQKVLERHIIYINVPYHKGTILRLTETELRLALQRGKAWQRAQQRADRQAKAEALGENS